MPKRPGKAQPKMRPVKQWLSGIGTPLVGTPKSAAEAAFRRRLSVLGTIRRRVIG